MKQDIMILNVCRYKPKDSEVKKTSFNYILTNDESFSKNDNYRGYSVLTLFLDNDYFEDLSNLIFKSCVLDCDFISNTKNPLRPKVKIKTITDVKSNKTISLV